MVNYGIRHFKSRWFETVNRFGHSELLPDTNFFFRTYYTIFICSPVGGFIALSLTLSSSDYLCAVISYLLSDFTLS